MEKDVVQMDFLTDQQTVVEYEELRIHKESPNLKMVLIDLIQSRAMTGMKVRL